MIIAVYLSIYSGILLFVGGSAWRAYRYARLPVHLRWELYPIPHEEPQRARYGGSLFEDQHGTARPQRRHFLGEGRAMAAEILFFKSLRESNPRLWLDSYLFHFGIYCAFAAVAISAAAGLFGFASTFSIAGVMIGSTGAVLIITGAFLLLTRRLTEPDLRNSTRPGDLFNLLFFLATFLLLLIGYLLRPAGSASLAELAQGALRFDRDLQLGGTFATGLILASALAAYIPFTHMSHYVAKYFTWHTVRWDDRHSEAGSAIERNIRVSLVTKPTWSAPHMGDNSQKTWAEIVTTPSEEVRG